MGRRWGEAALNRRRVLVSETQKVQELVRALGAANTCLDNSREQMNLHSSAQQGMTGHSTRGSLGLKTSSATHLLCDLGQVTQPLWASVFSRVKIEIRTS